MNQEDRAVYFLNKLDTGLRTEWPEIERLEANTQQLLADAKALGDHHMGDMQYEWEERWAELQTAFGTMRYATHEAGRCIAAGGVEEACAPWDVMQVENQRLDELLAPIMDLGEQALPEEIQGHWSDLWTLIEAQLRNLRAHEVSVHFEFALRHKYGAQRASALRPEILATLPRDASFADVEEYAQAYRRAYDDIQRERQEVGDRQDTLKALFMYVETPEERLAAW